MLSFRKGEVLLPVFGNHDDNGYEQKYKDAIISEAEIKSLLDPLAGKGAAIVSSGDDEMDYWIDISEDKVGFLILNTAGREFVTLRQKEFVVKSLTSINEGYQIIVFGHIWLEWNQHLHCYEENEWARELIVLFDAYNHRAKLPECDFTYSKSYVNLIMGATYIMIFAQHRRAVSPFCFVIATLQAKHSIDFNLLEALYLNNAFL